MLVMNPFTSQEMVLPRARIEFFPVSTGIMNGPEKNPTLKNMSEMLIARIRRRYGVDSAPSDREKIMNTMVEDAAKDTDDDTIPAIWIWRFCVTVKPSVDILLIV